MNKEKLKQLFAAARKAPAPQLSAGFAADVLRAVNNEPPPRRAELFSVWDYLNSLFPRIALAAAMVIILCAAADWGLTAAGLPEMDDSTAQMTSQYLFSPGDL